MNNTSKSIIAILVIALIVIVGIAFESRTKQQDQGSDGMRTLFINSCAETGQYAYCNCVYDDLFSRLGSSGIVNMSMEFQNTGKLPASATPSVTKCISSYDYQIN